MIIIVKSWSDQWSPVSCKQQSVCLHFCGNSLCLSMGWAWRSGMGEHFPFFPKPLVLYIWNLPGPWGLCKHLWNLKKSGNVEDWKEQIKKIKIQNMCFSKLEVKHKNMVIPLRLVFQQTCIPGLMCHIRDFCYWRLHLEKVTYKTSIGSITIISDSNSNARMIPQW